MLSKQYSLWGGLALLAPVAHAAAFEGKDHTWWVDGSCNGLLGDAVGEAFGSAKVIRDRLPSDMNAMKDSPAADAFKTLFARDDPEVWYLGAAATDTIDKLFGSYAHSLQKFEVNPSGDQLESEIRFYCDNDDRWIVRPDDPKQSEGIVNSKREAKDKEWIDYANQIVIRGTPACQVDGTTTGAVTYGRLGPGMEGSPLQHPNRVTVTICKWYLDNAKRIKTFDKDIPAKKTFSKNADKTIDQLREVTSMVILHELMHHSRFNKKDLPEDSPDAYMWKNCINKDNNMAADNADNWMILGILCRLLDRKFRLDKDDPKSGVLVWDNTIPNRPGVTKRWDWMDMMPMKPRNLDCSSEEGADAGYECKDFTA